MINSATCTPILHRTLYISLLANLGTALLDGVKILIKNGKIITEVSYNDKYRLNSIIPIKTFVNRINILVQSPLEDAAQDLVAGLVKPHSVSPHKTVQVSLEEISKTLSKISTKLDTVDETD